MAELQDDGFLEIKFAYHLGDETVLKPFAARAQHLPADDPDQGDAAFWPVYAPMAALLVEPRGRRRPLMLLCLALGIGVSLYFCSSITRFHEAVILKGHVVYSTEHGSPVAIDLAYLAATSLSLVLSSRRLVAALGVIILVGSAVAYAFYWEAFISVWCFFAAAASVVILWHFETSRRQHHGTATPWRPGDIAGGPWRG